MTLPPTLISKKANNWVDRGASPTPTMHRILAHFFERFESTDESWLDEHVRAVFGLVAADATEVHVAGYLRHVVRESGAPPREPLGARAAAVALWHVAKVALVRDFAERVLRGDVPANVATHDALSHWLAARLLTREDLARHEQAASDESPYA